MIDRPGAPGFQPPLADDPPTHTGQAAAAPPPPPPPAPPRPAAAAAHSVRAGRLTVGWQIMLAAAWAATFFAFAATWKVSEELGIGTWWLGPRAQPQPMPVRLIPFALALAMALAAIYNVRRVGWISLGGAVAVAAIASFDISRSGGLAAIEFAIAAGAACVSVGALAGTAPEPRRKPPAGSPSA